MAAGQGGGSYQTGWSLGVASFFVNMCWTYLNWQILHHRNVVLVLLRPNAVGSVNKLLLSRSLNFFFFFFFFFFLFFVFSPCAGDLRGRG